MKKSFFLLLAVLLVGFGYAQKAPTTKLISSSENRIVVNVQLNGYNTIKVETPRGEQFVVTAPDMATTLDAGAPELPMFPIPAIIGDMAEMTVNVIDASYTDVNNIDIAPSKGNISRQVNPADVPFTYGAMYDENAFYPAAQATLEEPYILRDFRGQNIMVHPFAYNPQTHTLRVYNNLTIEMVKVSNNGVNQKVNRRSNTIKMTPEQKGAYARRFINFTEATKAYPFLPDNGEMLIICPDQYVAGMQEFVEWKNKSGRPTTIVSVTEAGGNNDTQIKSYITNFYNNPEHNLVYVLFVGDYADLTPHSLGAERSDSWFGQIEGSDHYPEVFIGRFSVQTDAQLATHVNKVIGYERDVQANITWGDKGMGIGYYGAGSGHYGEDDYQHIDLIRDTLLHYTYSTVTEHHGGSGGDASVATISGTINQGISIINYCNHGSETSWGVANYSTSNVHALTNDNMLPIVWSVACLNGKFGYGSECFAEAWMRATNNSTGAPTGAIGGMFSWMSQPWVPPMYGQDEMVDILTEWRDNYYHTLGGASLNGSMAVIDKSGASGYDTHDTWILFGDPSMMVRTTNPTDMGVTAAPSVLMLGMTELQITADAAYGIATLSLDGEVIATGNIENGQCTLQFPAISNVGNADLVVMGYNRVTYMGTIEVVPAEGAYITVDSYELSNPANYGESVDLSIDFKNVGVEIANNVTVTLSTENEYVNITSAEGSVATINPNEVLTIEGFQFEVSANVPDGTRARLDVTITNGTDTWTGKVFVDLHAPVVAFNGIVDADNQLTFTFSNTGSAPFYGGQLSLTSCSPDLVFDPATITVDDVIAGGETLTLATTYSFSDNVEPASSFEMAYDFTTGAFSFNGLYTLTYEALIEGFESGTFSNDWTFNQTGAWTIVDGAGVDGTKCAKSNNPGVHNSDYYMTLTVNVVAAGDLTFMYKVSSENNYDKLHFYMDGQEKGVWSGTVDWTLFTQPVTVGQHTFKWSYTKDSSVNSGSDCAWVDNIVFPISNVFTFIEPATELVAELNDNVVTLNWTASPDAANYLVKRNGETIATVTETTLEDTLEDYGTYEYAVYAVNAEGSMSTPVRATVEYIDYTDVTESQNANVNIYPNPVKGTLYIQGGEAEFSYVMVNGMGQQVAKGIANGTKTINVNDMSKGVYFLRITTGSNVTTQKVVVE